jgi:putative endonuclease
MRSHDYAVYILANARPTLYVGVTSDLQRRLREHRRMERPDCFTARYRLHKLVHVEYFDHIVDAIRREKQIKSMSRADKLRLVRASNPTLRDLMPPVWRMLPPKRTPPPDWELRRWR